MKTRVQPPERTYIMTQNQNNIYIYHSIFVEFYFILFYFSFIIGISTLNTRIRKECDHDVNSLELLHGEAGARFPTMAREMLFYAERCDASGCL